ncbi:helix-turn-helix domain-containing protein [Blastomonas sp. AAP53]|uniref:IclR family transcriptional regulator n=1 Tax=Blastomonas sp. AAP53 TaxID=1248760 RepID=UPI0002FDCA4D|nr:helix-turn-helix domain-containing protein [Blastomonas sp. AAP53]
MSQPAVKSALRTFEVLELFVERRTPLHLHEIHTTLGYPQSSTTALLKSMVMMGYLNYDRDHRTYLPTTRVSQLGNWLPDYIQAAGGYRELVEELQRRTDETVALITRNDLFVQYIILLTPDHEYQMAPQVGVMRKLVDSSGGLSLMARMDDRAIEKLCRYSNAYYGGGERVSYAQLMRQVEWVRHVGYAYVPNRPTPAVSSITMALDADLGGVPLALGVGGLAERIADRKDAIVETLQDLVTSFRPTPR